MTKQPAHCVVWSWLLLSLAVAIPHTVVTAMVAVYLPLWCQWLLWGSWILVLLVFWGWYLPVRWRRMRYLLGEDSIEVTGGVIIGTTRRIRRDAVRQVTLWQGPIERRTGTAFLLVSATGGYLLAEGVDLKQAEDWCRRLYPQ